MRFGVELIGDLAEELRKEAEEGERAVKSAMAAAGRGLQQDWRNQVEAAGLGSRLARTIRSEAYPKGRNSLNAAALVWTRAPDIIEAFDRGALIRSSSGFYLAIPTAAAGTRGLGNKRITPGGWEQRTGMRLRFVYRPNGPSLLVADDARLNTRGMAAMNRRRARRDGTRTGSVTVPIFVLLPQVRLAKRLDLARDAQKWAGRLPQMITANWRD